MSGSTLTKEYEEMLDAADNFCYDIAQAIRRLVGIDTPDEDFEEDKMGN